MNAIVIEKVGGPEVLTFKDVPKPTPRAGEVLIKIGAAGINFIDTYFRSGMYKKDVPFTAGQEGAGTIEAVGDGTDLAKEGMKIGDRVVFVFFRGDVRRICRRSGRETDSDSGRCFIRGRMRRNGARHDRALLERRHLSNQAR